MKPKYLYTMARVGTFTISIAPMVNKNSSKLVTRPTINIKMYPALAILSSTNNKCGLTKN